MTQNIIHDYHWIIQETQKTLACLYDLGVEKIECSEKSLNILHEWDHPPTPSSPSGKNETSPQERLDALKYPLNSCQKCGLGAQKKNLVFGAGDPKARLVFVGEAPGFEEDRQGMPFVGASGQLLTKMIQAMGLDREDVYICNVLKCRPPNNRNPFPEEIIACMPALEQQLEIIQPEIICTLGGFAAKTLLNKSQGITALRGRFHDYQGIQLMPTFHPAYLLRNANKKRDAWEDLKKIMAALGLKKP